MRSPIYEDDMISRAKEVPIAGLLPTALDWILNSRWWSLPDPQL